MNTLIKLSRNRATTDICGYRQRGMTLAEILAALLVGSMVLAAVLGIYMRVHAASVTMMEQLNRSDLPAEVLQLIAEDLDKLVATGQAVQVKLATKGAGGYRVTQLQLIRRIQDDDGKDLDIEQTTWQTALDPSSDGLTLYRAHQGDILEDRVLQKDMSRIRKAYPFVPICSGLSVFRIEIPAGDAVLDAWNRTELPPGVRITLSFAAPRVSAQGTITVDAEDEIVRTIAIDRTRPIRFEVPKIFDANDPGASGDLSITTAPQERNAVLR